MSLQIINQTKWVIRVIHSQERVDKIHVNYTNNDIMPDEIAWMFVTQNSYVET